MKSSRKTKGPKQSKRTRNTGCNRRRHLRDMLEYGEVGAVLVFAGKGGNKVSLDIMDPNSNKVFGLDVEDNHNNMYLKEDLKVVIQDCKDKYQCNKACRWIWGLCDTGHKKSWKRQLNGCKDGEGGLKWIFAPQVTSCDMILRWPWRDRDPKGAHQEGQQLKLRPQQRGHQRKLRLHKRSHQQKRLRANRTSNQPGKPSCREFSDSRK